MMLVSIGSPFLAAGPFAEHSLTPPLSDDFRKARGHTEKKRANPSESDGGYVVHEMVSCCHNVVTKQRYFDGESLGWRGFSLVTFRNFCGVADGRSGGHDTVGVCG
jgi:hypothetical protein